MNLWQLENWNPDKTSNDLKLLGRNLLLYIIKSALNNWKIPSKQTTVFIITSHLYICYQISREAKFILSWTVNYPFPKRCCLSGTECDIRQWDNNKEKFSCLCSTNTIKIPISRMTDVPFFWETGYLLPTPYMITAVMRRCAGILKSGLNE